MQRSNLFVLLVLGLLAALGNGIGLRGLQREPGEEEPKTSNVTVAQPEGGQQEQCGAPKPSNQTAQVNATRGGERPAGAGGNETRFQGQPSNATAAAGEEGRPVNASEANSTKHIVVVGRPYYGGYGYPGYSGCGGYYGGCGGYGYGWRRHLRGNATEQRSNATTPGGGQAASNTTVARPGQERRPPAANVTSEEQQGEQRGNVTAANQTGPVEAGKDGWHDEHGHWHERGGWNDHHHHHGGCDHHHHGGWRDEHGHWHA